MSSLHNLKPEKVIKAFGKAGWVNKGQRGSHVKPVKQGKILSRQPTGERLVQQYDV